MTTDGLTVQHTIKNHGDGPAPVAIGAHPYLRLGTWDVKDLTLTIAAAAILPLDENYFPTPRRKVQGPHETLSGGCLVSDSIDHACFTELTAQESKFRHALAAPDGTAVELWADPDFAYVQIYATDEFPDNESQAPNATCSAIAIEPMTAPPNALNSGEGLNWLEPGKNWTLSWGVTLRSPAHVGS